MHLLFATSIVPDGALGSGYEIANAAIIDGLRRAGVRVTVLGFVWPGRSPSDPENTIVLGEVDVRTNGAPLRRKLAWLRDAMLSGLTFSSVKLRMVGPATVRRAVEAAGPFDAYVLNSVQFAGAFEGVFDDRPTLFVAHNVEHRSAAGKRPRRPQRLPALPLSSRGAVAGKARGAALRQGAFRLHPGRRRPRSPRRRIARHGRPRCRWSPAPASRHRRRAARSNTTPR